MIVIIFLYTTFNKVKLNAGLLLLREHFHIVVGLLLLLFKYKNSSYYWCTDVHVDMPLTANFQLQMASLSVSQSVRD